MEIIHSKLSKQTMKRILANPTSGKYLGHGATAKVYLDAKNKGRAIRIQKHNGDYDPEEHLIWAKFCLRSRSKHVPKIYMIAVERDEDGYVEKVITVMECLEEMPQDDATDTASYIIGDYLNSYANWSEMKRTPDHVKQGFPERAARSLRKTLSKHNIYLRDMHGGNWMKRPKDGRIVITDPLC